MIHFLSVFASSLFLWGACATTGVSIAYGCAGVGKVLALPVSKIWDWNALLVRFLFWGALATGCFTAARVL